MRWPSKEVQDRWGFVFKGVQAFAILLGALWALMTYTITAERESRKPYDEKQLALYLDAARILAHLAATPEYEAEKTEARLWELYWGELAFVESPHIADLMVTFCQKRFASDENKLKKCTTKGSDDLHKPPTLEAAAINMSYEASKEIRDRWERPSTKWLRWLFGE